MKYLLLLALAAALSSCVSPKSVYPEIYAKQKYKKVAVSSDVSILQDGPGKSNILLEDKSLETANKVNNMVISILDQKGYNTKKAFNSTGLSITEQYSVNVFVSNDPNAKSGKPLHGPHSIKYNDRAVSKYDRLLIEKVFERLHGVNLLSKESKQVAFPEVQELARDKQQYAVIVAGYARNVDLHKQFGQIALTAVASGGLISVYEADTAVVNIAVIDCSTGKIVWGNEVQIEQGKPQHVGKNVQKLLKDLPAYGSSAS